MNILSPSQKKLLSWSLDIETISHRIINRPATLKILLKTRDEPIHLEQWIEHHRSIVGESNLIVADNGSQDPVVLDKLLSLSDRLGAVFQFDGFHNTIHSRKKFNRLYDALARSTDYFIFLDSDERLVWTESGQWIANLSIQNRLIADPRIIIHPGILLDNYAERAKDFYFAGDSIHEASILNWGKPILNAKLDLGPKEMLHNCQYPVSLFQDASAINVVVLHLTRLDPRIRLEANRKKFISRGLISPSQTVEDILTLDPKCFSKSSVAKRCYNEIKAILKYLDTSLSASWGPSDIRYAAHFAKDGIIKFHDHQLREKFIDFTKRGAKGFFQ